MQDTVHVCNVHFALGPASHAHHRHILEQLAAHRASADHENLHFPEGFLNLASEYCCLRIISFGILHNLIKILIISKMRKHEKG